MLDTVVTDKRVLGNCEPASKGTIRVASVVCRQGGNIPPKEIVRFFGRENVDCRDCVNNAFCISLSNHATD